MDNIQFLVNIEKAFLREGFFILNEDHIYELKNAGTTHSVVKGRLRLLTAIRGIEINR